MVDKSSTHKTPRCRERTCASHDQDRATPFHLIHTGAGECVCEFMYARKAGPQHTPNKHKWPGHRENNNAMACTDEPHKPSGKARKVLAPAGPDHRFIDYCRTAKLPLHESIGASVAEKSGTGYYSSGENRRR